MTVRRRAVDKEQLLTVDEILGILRGEGYQLTKRTYQYYVQAGLLPKGVRRGAASGGVRFYNDPSVLGMVRLIFALKARGFKINEIREHLIAEESGGAAVVAQTGEAGPFPAASAVNEPAAVPADLYERVMAQTPGGEALRRCLQCGTCGGSCPSADDMDRTPRELFALLQAGRFDEALAANTPWFCISCYYCTIRCPQQIPITEILYTVKQLAIRAGLEQRTDAFHVSRIHVNLLEKYGRSFDMGYAFRYHLSKGKAGDLSWGSLSLNHHHRQKVVIGPARIENIKQFRKILAKAKALEQTP
jgi:heterodisulfide reductase subunit C